MKTLKKIISALILIGLLALTLLFNGCGRQEAKDEGCPSGTYVANSTDAIAGPLDEIITVNSGFDNPSPGGTVIISPLTYTVNDKDGNPRNKVCITLYTDGIWYSDNTYSPSSVVNGTGPLNRIVAVTDASGKATLYWSTEILPPANQKTLVLPITVPPTYTAGSNITGESFINAYSGVLGDLFTWSWTVTGEPAAQ
jgi:hypothetical protein